MSFLCDVKTVDPRDKFLVVNSATRKAVESQPSERQAVDATVTLNEHELRNKRPAVYEVVKL